MRIASLPMYDFPELVDATNQWWSGLARAFEQHGIRDVPRSLERKRSSADLWRDPSALLLSQTCGYPLMHSFSRTLRVVATPRYTAPGCANATYRSVVIVPRGSTVVALAGLRGAVCGVNERASHSGMNALRARLSEVADSGPFFGRVVLTGSHRSSMKQVADGVVNVAAIDCVTYALLARIDPDLVAGTRVLTETAPAPALPYVTGRNTTDDEVRRMRDALAEAIEDPDLAAVRDTLLIGGIEVLPENAYEAILDAERTAEARNVTLD